MLPGPLLFFFLFLHPSLIIYNILLRNILQETDEVKAQIATFGGGKKGEVKTKRAGRILEPQKDGYYRKELFVPDCIKVDFTIY